MCAVHLPVGCLQSTAYSMPAQRRQALSIIVWMEMVARCSARVSAHLIRKVTACASHVQRCLIGAGNGDMHAVGLLSTVDNTPDLDTIGLELAN